ncbi:dihydroneopterin aldolase [Acidiphilium sp.]|uniref:dihydroneopterin aldolase n=1 Tax=Acidiphilium sp. TaxID=527 RepID=UPI003CFBFB7E
MKDISSSADAASSIRRMFIRDLVLDAAIGVYAHEHDRTQRIRINLDLAIEEDVVNPVSRQFSRPGVGRDDLARVVDYEKIVNDTRATVASGHVQLVETLAERVAELCLTDPRVILVRVRVEKLDVFPDAASAGVEIERRR